MFFCCFFWRICIDIKKLHQFIFWNNSFTYFELDSILSDGVKFCATADEFLVGRLFSCFLVYSLQKKFII